jgi:hypothetical protein
MATATTIVAALLGVVACGDDVLVVGPTLAATAGVDRMISVSIRLRSTKGVERIEVHAGPDLLRLREVATYPAMREQEVMLPAGPFGGARMYVAFAIAADGTRASSNVEIIEVPPETLLETAGFDPAKVTFTVRDVEGADERYRWRRVQAYPDATTFEFDPDVYVRGLSPIPEDLTSFTVDRREPGGPSDLFVIEYRQEGQLLGMSNVASASPGALPVETSIWPREGAIECSWDPVAEALVVWFDGEIVDVPDPASGRLTIAAEPDRVVEVEIAARLGEISGPGVVFPAGGFGTAGMRGGVDNLCVLDDVGRVWCRGRDDYGQVGRGFPAESATELRPLGPVVARSDMAGPWLDDVVRFDARDAAVIAIHGDGRVSYWGMELHAPVDAASGRPLAVARPQLAVHADGNPIEDAVDAVTGAVTCVVLSDGDVECLGKNDHGQLGVGIVADVTAPSTTAFSTVLTAPGEPLTGITRVFSDGSDNVCAVDGGGGMWCWGHNASHATGTGITAETALHVPFATRVVDAVGPVTDVQDVVVAGTSTCALFADGRIGCAGQIRSADGGTYEHAYLLEVTGPWRAEWIRLGGELFVMREATTGEWRMNSGVEGFFEPYELPGLTNVDAEFQTFAEPFFVRHDGTIVRLRTPEDPLNVDFPVVGFWP